MSTQIALFSEGVEAGDQLFLRIDGELQLGDGVKVYAAAPRGAIAGGSQNRRGLCHDRVVNEIEARISRESFCFVVVGDFCVGDAQKVSDFLRAALVAGQPAVLAIALEAHFRC